MNDETMNIYELLSYFQKRISVPKDKKNKGGFNFRDISGINAAFRAVQNEGDAPEQVKTCALILDDELTQPEGRIVMKGSATLQSSDGKKITTYGFAEIDFKNKFMQVPQLYGAASSYARKYAAQGLFALQDNDNDFDSIEKEQLKQRIKRALKDRFEEQKIPDDLMKVIKKVGQKDTQIQELIEILNEVEEYK